MAQTLTSGIATDKNAQYVTAKNWINGEWVDSSKHTDSFDSAIGNRIGSYADASLADAQSVVTAAVHAFEASDWKDNRKLPAKVLNQIAPRARVEFCPENRRDCSRVLASTRLRQRMQRPQG
jgi:hypothetical protein